MTVRDLIAELSALDPDLPIYEPHPYHSRQYEPRRRREPLAPTTLYLYRHPPNHGDTVTDRETGALILPDFKVEWGQPGEAFQAVIL